MRQSGKCDEFAHCKMLFFFKNELNLYGYIFLAYSFWETLENFLSHLANKNLILEFYIFLLLKIKK